MQRSRTLPWRKSRGQRVNARVQGCCQQDQQEKEEQEQKLPNWLDWHHCHTDESPHWHQTETLASLPHWPSATLTKWPSVTMTHYTVICGWLKLEAWKQCIAANNPHTHNPPAFSRSATIETLDNELGWVSGGIDLCHMKLETGQEVEVQVQMYPKILNAVWIHLFLITAPLPPAKMWK